ncbi:MAG: hypothetical protein R3A79_30395 [Nannocystaceae bacterium]
MLDEEERRLLAARVGDPELGRGRALVEGLEEARALRARADLDDRDLAVVLGEEEELGAVAEAELGVAARAVERFAVAVIARERRGGGPRGRCGWWCSREFS